MRTQKKLSLPLLFLLSTGLFAGCGLFNPESDIDLDIMTDRTNYAPGDTIRITIRNTGSETVYYNSCQLTGLIALQENKVVERIYFGTRLCYNPTAFAPDEQSVSDFPYGFIAETARQCTSRAIDQYRLYFEYFSEKDLGNRLPARHLQSNAFSLDSLGVEQG
ncbi:MAG: hypothetical protein GF372_07485 [Candidatus Marinimicrobia bacterium]|nr:hypothetical protein [Candidatus Neomarinimicrobiota bacterium]